MILLFCGFLTASCGDDDEESLPSLSNQLEYYDMMYDLTLGATFDGGPTGFSSNDTHFGRVFLVTDADNIGERVNLVFDTYSLGTSGFKAGRFDYGSIAGLTSAQRSAAYGNRSFFVNSYLVVDLNDDEELDNSEVVMITGGTVTISGTAPEYTLECDVVLENGQTVRAQYTGDFIDITDDIIDEDGVKMDEGDAKANRRAKSGISPFLLKAPKSLKDE
ncbi:hypothetical protein ACFSC6_12405 [Rufibacter sediminis]|uniref:Lipoprotein n=1 Tax=Rufibacter sediminis TaxID=2762756 RepID=A0ABR6VV57_9BACT|nr:hypothetical protein [Rufibacter sediminis]MBC3540683.1 hypothetical protein [Rufibacter sediminis]